MFQEGVFTKKELRASRTKSEDYKVIIIEDYGVQ